MRKLYFLTYLFAAVLALLLAACGTHPNPEQENDLALGTEEPSATETVQGEDADPGETTQPGSQQEPEEEPETPEDNTDEEETTAMKLKVSVNGESFTATLEENEAVDAWREMLEEAPLTIQMSDYAGFEKVGSLGASLPASNRQTTTQAGDIVLYQGNQIVIFYGSNSWSYTRLGRIDDLTGWEDALGDGDVSVTFSLTEPQA